MRGDQYLPPGVGNHAADVEEWFRRHMVGHGYHVFGFRDDQTAVPDGTIDRIPVEVKAVTRPDADAWSVNTHSVEKYDQIPGLIIAIGHPSWRSPRFVTWAKARRNLGPERPPTTSNRGGRFPYHWVRMSHARICRRCQGTNESPI